jgi:hypothetical protein
VSASIAYARAAAGNRLGTAPTKEWFMFSMVTRRTGPVRTTRSVALAMLVLMLAWVPAALAGKQDFTIVNRTTMMIHELYIAPSSQTSWDEDILGTDVLAPEEEVEIVFDPDEDAELWDLAIIDGEGNTVVWGALNLTTISKISLFQKNGETWVETE